ncbi:hypothetical protein [Xylanimonas sp. McL0601]|uniref:hypothetical protein n=1 Tax=Xylanimonas sp. McL0601 TaxID=3414739 RepID=UPI003CF71A40
MPIASSRRAGRLVVFVLALLTAPGLLGVVPAQAATAQPVTVTVTQVGDWYQAEGRATNRTSAERSALRHGRLDD